jgi:hypothetical protein|tara:strand:- start:178 stop:807 length:630 start_codon:yes stop_codon:yes gene_type:complete
MNDDGLAETIREFDNLRCRLFSGDELDKTYGSLKSWIDSEKSGIPGEILFMDELLGILRKKDSEEIYDYIRSGGYNTVTCGFYDMSVNDFYFTLHNETVPDHFAKILTLRRTSSMPFYYELEEGVTTQYFEYLKNEGKEILDRCYGLKKEILDSDDRFKQKSDIELEAFYLMKEASKIEEVEEIAGDMKKVYRSITKIINGMGSWIKSS